MSKTFYSKIATAVIRSQPLLNSQTITQILTRESCYMLWFVLICLLICFNCLESVAPAYRVLVYITHLIRYFLRPCRSQQDLLDKSLLLRRKLQNQGFILGNLKSSLGKFYNRHHELVNSYEISASHTTTYIPIIVGTSRTFSGPVLIHDSSPDL